MPAANVAYVASSEPGKCIDEQLIVRVRTMLGAGADAAAILDMLQKEGFPEDQAYLVYMAAKLSLGYEGEMPEHQAEIEMCSHCGSTQVCEHSNRLSRHHGSPSSFAVEDGRDRPFGSLKQRLDAGGYPTINSPPAYVVGYKTFDGNWRRALIWSSYQAGAFAELAKKAKELGVSNIEMNRRAIVDDVRAVRFGENVFSGPWAGDFNDPFVTFPAPDDRHPHASAENLTGTTLAAAPEPFRGELHWHKHQSRDGAYTADAGVSGIIIIESRSPDRRNGRLPWVVKLKGNEVDQADTKGDAQLAAARYLRKAHKVWKAAQNISGGDCVAIVERNPACSPRETKLATAQDVYAVMRSQADRLGHEVIWVLGGSIQDEMVSSPVMIASGQPTGVQVNVEQIIVAAIKLHEAGATSFFLVHNHPGNGGQASQMDKDLTRRVREAARIAAPNMQFRGHVIISSKGYAKA